MRALSDDIEMGFCLDKCVNIALRKHELKTSHSVVLDDEMVVMRTPSSTICYAYVN